MPQPFGSWKGAVGQAWSEPILKVDPEAITPTTTLAKIRETALAQHASR